MKLTTAYALAWISCGIAVSVAIIVTKNLNALWTFLIPAGVTITFND